MLYNIVTNTHSATNRPTQMEARGHPLRIVEMHDPVLLKLTQHFQEKLPLVNRLWPTAFCTQKTIYGHGEQELGGQPDT